jgi:hypothetical protein
MAARLFTGWRTEWRLRRASLAYVTALGTEPAEDDVRWLSAVTDGDVDRARWELRYARRALGLLVAERDALDDRTGSLVARSLAEALQVDRNVAAGMVRIAERQFNDRLTLYHGVLGARSATDGTAVRLGRALLHAAAPQRAHPDAAVTRAGEILSGYLTGANEALRKIFGAPQLPEDQPPSALTGRPHG